ncbi:MAG: cell division ATP-binding protein FtsE [Nitrospirae bacterium]|nr:cell division ATP-binding protein FtsE [Nitrospirota bacterium]
MISFHNVSKHYDNHTALNNITFVINKGEMAFITGQSGAGKTTLLKLIYMHETPDSGDIILGDYRIATLKKSQIPLLRRNIGVVFQDFRLLNNLSIFDNVALSLRIRAIAEKDVKAAAAEALKKVHLLHRADSYPKALSGGEQQKAVIARAIVSEPLLILADEPTGNLDPDTALEIMNVFKEINIKGTMILIATHNRDIFRHSGKRVLNIVKGSLTGEAIG